MKQGSPENVSDGIKPSLPLESLDSGESEGDLNEALQSVLGHKNGKTLEGEVGGSGCELVRRIVEGINAEVNRSIAQEESSPESEEIESSQKSNSELVRNNLELPSDPDKKDSVATNVESGSPGKLNSIASKIGSLLKVDSKSEYAKRLWGWLETGISTIYPALLGFFSAGVDYIRKIPEVIRTGLEQMQVNGMRAMDTPIYGELIKGLERIVRMNSLELASFCAVITGFVLWLGGGRIIDAKRQKSIQTMCRLGKREKIKEAYRKFLLRLGFSEVAMASLSTYLSYEHIWPWLVENDQWILKLQEQNYGAFYQHEIMPGVSLPAVLAPLVLVGLTVADVRRRILGAIFSSTGAEKGKKVEAVSLQEGEALKLRIPDKVVISEKDKIALRIVGNEIVVYQGDLVVLYGDSGHGKTTLFNILLGEYGLGRKGMRELLKKQKKAGEKGVVSMQGSGVAFSCRGKMCCSEQKSSFGKQPSKSIIRFTGNEFSSFSKKEIFEKVGAKNLIDRQDCSKLSGGETKRLSLAAALATNASIFLFDEPLEGLDDSNKAIILEVIKKLRTQGKTVIVVTHNTKLLKECFLGEDFGLKMSSMVLMSKEEESNGWKYCVAKQVSP
ncbi:MAG TPA: ATP-binding cassette domain-containing protein, partial [Candidatus Peregrinibacteria bacterium]|nr:ATP-binding cassette domain-containing protein [Candidatus Peregrinibacteria bacterium]